MGGRAGFGGPDDELLVGVTGAGQCVPVEGEFADQGVPEHLVDPAQPGDAVVAPKFTGPALERLESFFAENP